MGSLIERWRYDLVDRALHDVLCYVVNRYDRSPLFPVLVMQYDLFINQIYLTCTSLVVSLYSRVRENTKSYANCM